MNKINICSWNANGIKNRMGELIEFIDRFNIDILMINETKCTSKDKLKIRSYTCLRSDRENSAGGVAIFIRNTVPYRAVKICDSVTLECICIKLVSDIYLVAAYNNPRNEFTSREIHKLLNIGRKVILFGDLNARNKIWNCHVENRRGKILLNYVQNNNCSLMYPNEPTLYPDNGSTPTTIDIGINKNVHSLTDIKVAHELSSDHLPVLFSLNDQHKIVKNRLIYDYDKTDWPNFRSILNKEIEITPKITCTNELERQVQKLTNTLQNCINKTIPKKPLMENCDNLPPDIIKKIHDKRSLRKMWQRTRNKDYKIQFNRQTHLINAEIFKYRNTKWGNQLKMLNPNDNSLWRMTKILKKEYHPIPTLHKNDEVAFTPIDKAQMLATQYEKVHDIDLQNLTNEQNQIVQTVNNFITKTQIDDYIHYYTNPIEIIKTIKMLPSKKAPGIDNIQNIILKNLTKKSIVQLMYIINAAIRMSHFPSHWKTGNIMPIHKVGKCSTEPSSYRPICLLPTLSKLTEKIILKRLNAFEKKERLIIDEQFGFREQHSTVQQLVRIVNDICTNFNLNKVTVMLFLDIEKAFDRVWIDGLIYKMIQYNYPPILIKLIYSYLQNRNLIVTVDGSSSTKRKVLAGVPQGSVLGPKLFNINLNDIPKFEKTKMSLFADDTAIYSHSFSAIVAAKQIQLHLYKLEKFYRDWKISLNATKTELIVFAKKTANIKIFQPVTLYGHPIRPTACVKYLGTFLDSKLTFKAHIKQSLRKVYSVQKKLYPLMSKNSKLSMKNKNLIYKMILRPILVYGAPVWCSAAKTNLKPLQIFQNKCLRLILSASRYSRITELHEQANIKTINDYIKSLAENFYAKRLQSSNLTKDIINITKSKLPFRLKHKLPYQGLSFFNN